MADVYEGNNGTTSGDGAGTVVNPDGTGHGKTEVFNGQMVRVDDGDQNGDHVGIDRVEKGDLRHEDEDQEQPETLGVINHGDGSPSANPEDADHESTIVKAQDADGHASSNLSTLSAPANAAASTANDMFGNSSAPGLGIDVGSEAAALPPDGVVAAQNKAGSSYLAQQGSIAIRYNSQRSHDESVMEPSLPSGENCFIFECMIETCS